MSTPSTPSSSGHTHLRPVPDRASEAGAASAPAAPARGAVAPASRPRVSGKRAATRRRLLDACASLIVREGFEAVSMTAVAEEAGITRQTVYRYFSNARELVHATLKHGGREVLEGQLLVLQEDGDPKELLIDAVMDVLRLLRQTDLLRAAWGSRDYPQTMMRSTFDPAFSRRAVEGLRPLALRLGWSEEDTREAYDVIARTVISFISIPPKETLTDAQLRERLQRRLLPALGV